MSEIIVEKLPTFTLVDSRWDIQLWADSAKPVNAKVYRLRVAVPPEFIGEVEEAVDCGITAPQGP